MGGTLMPAHMKLRSAYENLSIAERKVADFILGNLSMVPHMVVNEIAERSGVSVPTVVRLAKKLGYQSFLNFRVALAVSHQLGDDDYTPISAEDSDEQLVHKVFSGSIQSLMETEQSLDIKLLSQLAGQLTGCRRIMLYGTGSSGVLCCDFCYMFNYLGIDTVTATEPNMAKIQASHLGPDDVFLALSRSGTTQVTMDVLEIAHSSGATCAFITNYLHSPAKELCEYFFCTSYAADQFEISQRDSNVSHSVLLTTIYLLIARKNLKG